MAELRHWTESSIDDFLYRIATDFVSQIGQAVETTPRMNQKMLARALGVSEGRVSQVLNNPGNLTLRKMIEYARALRRKVAVIAYDDNDPENFKGPINSEVFLSCWRLARKPSDFFELSQGTRLMLSPADSATPSCWLQFDPPFESVATTPAGYEQQ